MRQSNRLAALSIAFLLVLAGCGSGNSISAKGSSNGVFSIAPGVSTISTNSTLQFAATASDGSPEIVTWSTAGGDNGNPGSITVGGLFSPPSTIFHNVAVVQVIAQAQKANGSTVIATAKVTVTPGFLAPITPENVAVTPGSTAQLTAVLAQVGGGSVNWSLSNTLGGPAAGSNFGAFSAAACHNGSSINTFCTITYTAPASLPSGTARTFATATVANTTNSATAQVLLDANINSNPLSHQSLQSGAVQLGSSGGNAFDTDTDAFGNVIDCCGGTLGALLAGSDGQRYVLSTNHVLANSDQARAQDALIQPGLPDANCDPTQANVLGTLSFVVPLNSTTTNSDAALGLVNSGGSTAMQVNPTGNILEIGAVGTGGQLTAAPPAAGPGEAVTAGHVPARVVKSGRSTGLTCSTISSIATTVQLQYFSDCAETQPSTNKTYQNQILISGASFAEVVGGPAGVFSDITGDSGAVVLDQANAEPVGLLYATNDSSAVANPIGDVLHDLSQATQTQGAAATTFTFVGGAEHSVECLNYDAGTASASTALTPIESARARTASRSAANIVDARAGILGVARGASLDAPGHASVIVYTDGSRTVAAVPQQLGGVRTLVIPVDAASFSSSAAAKSRRVAPGIRLDEATLKSAIAVKQKHEQQWMSDAAVFAVGVGQSFDNPNEAAIVVLAERGKTPAWMPAVVDGVRVRYQFGDRFHTSHLKGYPTEKHAASCRESRVTKAAPLTGTVPPERDWQRLASRLPLF